MDILKTVANIPKSVKNIKRIVKEPINNTAEADARKEDVMSLLYLGAILLVLAIVLCLIPATNIIGTIVGLPAFAVLLVAAFLLSVISKAKQRFGVLTCDKCHTLAEIKTSESFAKYISYTVEKDEAEFGRYVGNKEPTNGVYSQVKYIADSKAIVDVALTCPNCGKVKHLKYYATPFKCHAELKNVGALQFPTARASLETAVREAVNNYNDPSKRALIPYSLHSSKNPHFEERTTVKGANAPGAHPDYMGVKIDCHADVADMLEQYFVLNQLNGTLSDPSKPQK